MLVFTPGPDGDRCPDCCNIAALCGLIRFTCFENEEAQEKCILSCFAAAITCFSVSQPLLLPLFTVLSNTDDSRQRGFIFLFALILRLLPPCWFCPCVIFPSCYESLFDSRAAVRPSHPFLLRGKEQQLMSNK